MKRRRLGQHYLADPESVRTILRLADINPTERVLEIGTGKGVLSTELARRGSSFLGYEIDKENYTATLAAVHGSKAEVVLANAFTQSPEFDVLVTSLPYSESATFVKWLSVRRFSRAVAVLQRDFAEKITAPPGARDYRGVTALAQIAFEMKSAARVARSAFDPPPRVDSVVVLFTPRRMILNEEAARVIRLFTLRRKLVDSALAELRMKGVGNHGKRRVFQLLPEEVFEICRLANPSE